jgi:hypothetical protein
MATSGQLTASNATQKTIAATLTTAVNATTAAWNSSQSVNCTATGLTISLPTPTASDFGKEIVLSNVGTNPFTVALTGGTLGSAIGLIMNPGSIWTFEAQSLTAANVSGTNAAQNVVSEFGSVILDGQTFSTTSFVNSTNGIYALPSKGTWRLRYDISTDGSGVSTVASMFAITDGSGNVVSGTEKARGGGSTIGAVLTAEATVTTTGPSTYLLRGRNGGAGAGTATILNASGTSTISWQKVSDFVPATLVAAVAGDRKFSDLLIDHGDWILLNGRLKSTLTAAQQAVATSLGYGTNIPDMRGRMALGIGGTIGATALSQGGSSTIGQNQLPNVALSGTITSVLAVTGGGSQAPSGFTSGTSGIPAWINGGSLSSGWPGGGNVTIGSLNGGVTQQAFVPSYAAGNWFVWLGSSATTVTAGGGGATLTKTLTYGAALNALQPVYMQSDGKVYPMIGSGGSLTGGAITTWFGAGVQSHAIAAIPGVANRITVLVPYSDGTVYHSYFDANPLTGAIALTQNTAITGGTPATISEGSGVLFMGGGAKALLAYTAGGVISLRNYSANNTGIVAQLGFTAITSNTSPSPFLVPTSSADKCLLSYRGASNSELRYIDVSSATPATGILASFPLNGSSLKNCFVFPLNTPDTFAFCNNNGTNLTIQPFSFNTSTNAYNTIGAGATLPLAASEVNFDVIYSDSAETWLAYVSSHAPTSVRVAKIIQATGAVSFFGPTTFTADSISNPVAIQVYGYKKALGKFLIAWNASTAPNQVKYGEWVLDRATGAISVSISAVAGVTTSNSWQQGRGYAGKVTFSTGYVFHAYGTNTVAEFSTFGTYATAAPAFALIGINQSAGALNATGAVDLRGSLQAGHTGLTPGANYFADLATGGITTSPTSGIYAGRAISTTELQVAS